MPVNAIRTTTYQRRLGKESGQASYRRLRPGQGIEQIFGPEILPCRLEYGIQYSTALMAAYFGSTVGICD